MEEYTEHLPTNLRDTALTLGLGQTEFIRWLLANRFIYRKDDGALRPYARKGGGCFELREWTNKTARRAGLQLMVTPAGREKFARLTAGSSSSKA